MNERGFKTMGILGRGKKKSAIDLMDPAMRKQLQSDPYLYPVLRLFEGIIAQDADELKEAMSSQIRCPACQHEFLLAHGVKKTGNPDSGEVRIECPRCKESPMSLGYGPK